MYAARNPIKAKTRWKQWRCHLKFAHKTCPKKKKWYFAPIDTGHFTGHVSFGKTCDEMEQSMSFLSDYQEQSVTFTKLEISENTVMLETKQGNANGANFRMHTSLET